MSCYMLQLLQSKDWHTCAARLDVPDGSCRRLQDPNRTILGAPQREYLKSQLSAAEGKHTWKVLGQQVRGSKPVAQVRSGRANPRWHEWAARDVVPTVECACSVVP